MLPPMGWSGRAPAPPTKERTCCVARKIRRQCPLWVKSGHFGVPKRCPLYPQEQTLELSRVMSALCQKQTFCTAKKMSLYDPLWTSSDRWIACSSLSAEIRFTRPLVPGVGRSGYADMGRTQGRRPALAQIREIRFSWLDPVDQFRVAGVAAQHHKVDRQTD